MEKNSQNKTSFIQTIILITLGLFIALLLTEAFFRVGGLVVNKEITTPPNKNKDIYRILCIGDSSTYGLGSTDPKKYSYPDQLQTLLNEYSHNNKFEIANLGVQGINSSQVFNSRVPSSPLF